MPVLAGCGGGGAKPAPAPMAAAAREAAAVVARFESAIARGDFATVCELLSAPERAQAGGSDCARLMAARASGIRRPRIRIRSIELTRAGAIVHVRTIAVGQAPTNDVIRLVREHGKLRIASLGH